VTTLTDFRDRLNEHPEDWACLLALADFLMDTDPTDPRIEGYKWLGQRRLCPWFYTGTKNWGFRWDGGPFWALSKISKNCYIPEVVFRKVRSERNCKKASSEVVTRRNKPRNHGPFLLFKSVALAFSELPPHLRAELLAQPPLIEVPEPSQK